MTSRTEIQGWFRQGVKKKCTHLIVVCDTFDHEDYPVYVEEGQKFDDVYDVYKGGQNMQRVMEIYDLKKSWASQKEGIVWNRP